MTNLVLITVAELERHKTNMNTKEKHIILSIFKVIHVITNPTSHAGNIMNICIAPWTVFPQYLAMHVLK